MFIKPLEIDMWTIVESKLQWFPRNLKNLLYDYQVRTLRENVRNDNDSIIFRLPTICKVQSINF